VSRVSARNAVIKDISLDNMVVTTVGKDHTIPLSPPMKSFREARERLVSMDNDTITGLQRNKITVKEYVPPRGFHAVVFAACLATFILLSRPANYLPGSLIHTYFPQFAVFVYSVRNWIIYPMVALHLVECFLMRRKMEKHSVALFSRVWWMWLVSSFIEGAGSFQR
jgi:hypothetical protein